MRNIVVTGGSRGIGLGICRELAACGYRALAVGRKENDELRVAIRDAERLAPGSLRFISYDLSNLDGMAALVKGLREEFGPLYGLVNNAGISFDGTLALMPVNRIEELVRVNTLAPMLLTRAMVRFMLADGGGRIVNVASIVASTGYSGLSVYAATKASLIGFTRSLAREIGKVGINVNAVAPGFVRTDLTQSLDEDQRQKIERRSALRRLTEIEDVANAVQFLLSDRAKNITGTVLTVDAGSTA